MTTWGLAKLPLNVDLETVKLKNPSLFKRILPKKIILINDTKIKPLLFHATIGVLINEYQGQTKSIGTACARCSLRLITIT